MSRQDVYASLGQPVASREETKGFAFWHRDLRVGRWEFFSSILRRRYRRSFWSSLEMELVSYDDDVA